MALITENIRLNDVTYRMKVQCPPEKVLGHAGQFYMIKTSDTSDPLLGRPICVFDTDEDNHIITFIYAPIGRGTNLLTRMNVNDNITINGPYGKSFPVPDADITLIGGGVGAAPLYHLCKEHKALYPNRKRIMHIGFRQESDVLLVDEFRKLCDDVIVNIGGFVTDDVDYTKKDNIYFACGTMPMMGAAAKLAIGAGRTMYLSLEKHMACGVGACLVCTCETKDGTRKRVCKDGPVFLADDVYDAERGCFYE